MERIIEGDPTFTWFLKSKLTRRFRKLMGIKTPWFGQNRGKVIIADQTYPNLVMIYAMCRGNPDFMESKTSKLDAVKTDNTK